MYPDRFAAAGSVSYVTGAHNIKVGYQGYFSAVHNGRVPNHTQLRYTFNNQVPISVSYFLAPRWDQHDRTETFGLFKTARFRT